MTKKTRSPRSRRISNDTLDQMLAQEGLLAAAEAQALAELEQMDARRRKVREVVRKFQQIPKTGEALTDADFYDEDGFPK